MKTPEELFKKYEMLAPTEENPDVFDQHTDCVFYDNFIDAIKEDRRSVIELIDEMIGNRKEKLGSKRLTAVGISGLNLSILALQELKEKLEKEK